MAQGKAAVIRSDLDIVIARTLARDTAKSLGFGAIDQARIATAVSELARNVFLYAGTGTVTVREVERSGRKGIEVICEDLLYPRCGIRLKFSHVYVRIESAVV